MPKVQISKNDLWKAVRKQCLDCVGSSDEVMKCTSLKCSLYDFRFGRPLKKHDLVYLGDNEYNKPIKASDKSS